MLKNIKITKINWKKEVKIILKEETGFG
jgi:hypothetical protein